MLWFALFKLNWKLTFVFMESSLKSWKIRIYGGLHIHAEEKLQL